MDKPTLFDPYAVTPEIDVIPSWFPIPGFGILPIHAYLLRAAEPVLVDAGLASLAQPFMEKLSTIIDPQQIKWLWLTHNDQDHIGAVRQLLAAAPQMQVVTTFLGMEKMRLFQPLPADRIHLINPGQTLDVGDRKLLAIKPPAYDAPETTGFYDAKTSSLFSADCFGTLMSKPVRDAAEIGLNKLRKGLIDWATVDFPWLHQVEEKHFNNSLNLIRELSPELILSGHLPPARNMTNELLGFLAEVPGSRPFIGPDQQDLATLSEGNDEETPDRELVLRARELLQSGRTLQLASMTRDGKPAVRNIAYVFLEGTLYFQTGYASDKYQQIRNNPDVAALISIDEEDWSKSQQLKIEGQARLETDQEKIREIKKLLGEKYSGLKDLPLNPGHAIFAIQPKTGQLMDNAKAPFSDEEISF